MSAIIVDVIQGSPEWLQARCGYLTSTCASDMLSEIKSGEAAARRDLRMRLVCERLTGVPVENGYVNAIMHRGLAIEPVARMAYEAQTGQIVQQVGFLKHCDSSILAGCSPDGYIGAFEGMVSLKCPKSVTHLRYLEAGGIPIKYIPQMLHELWISGAAYYDFVSFDDRFPGNLQYFSVRVPRDELAILDYAKQAEIFLTEVEHQYQRALEIGRNQRH